MKVSGTLCPKLRRVWQPGFSGSARLVRLQPNRGATPAPIRSILQRNAPAVRLRDLAAKDEPNPRSLRLRREIWNDQVRAAGQTRPFVLDHHRECSVLALPTDL